MQGLGMSSFFTPTVLLSASRLWLAVLLLAGMLGRPAVAMDSDAVDTDVSPVPPSLYVLQAAEAKDGDDKPDKVGLQIRADAIKEAALSYGARGGLAYRTFQVQQRLQEHQAEMTRTFDFRQLLIAAPSGLLIEPPIISEAQRGVLVSKGGQKAAVADRVLRINREARIVTAARDWRTYLERDWGKVEPPPSVLLPKTDEERAVWKKFVAEGWEEGLRQADEIFQADLDLLTNDFTGMVRYRELLAQDMINTPFALEEDRGVTGGGDEMRIGDRGVAITGPSKLNPRSDRWTPTPR
jgi:defect in organelle trafficking protein DotC